MSALEIHEIEDLEVRTFRVLENGKEIAQVWYSNDKARCVECSGPLVAMSTSCHHARSVARFVKAQQKKSMTPYEHAHPS